MNEPSAPLLTAKIPVLPTAETTVPGTFFVLPESLELWGFDVLAAIHCCSRPPPAPLKSSGRGIGTLDHDLHSLVASNALPIIALGSGHGAERFPLSSIAVFLS